MFLVPEQVLQQHEDGKVMFFCGAGVSVPAGLPNFKELVELTLSDLVHPEDDPKPNPIDSLAWQAFNEKKYDDCLGILESPQHGGYDAKVVREKVQKHLSIKRVKTRQKHHILAKLADLDKESGRLVTTNFDSYFERAQENLRRESKSKCKLRLHIAPTLPPAKPNTFQGLAYLHGKLGESLNNQQLVLTTSDFGMAYMLDGWARRFVIDLFRYYHVVFVGYSLEDPTIRYLVQALAAVRNERSEQFKEPYAFADYCSETVNDKNRVEQQWKLKGITPILYDEKNKHQQLWQALLEWSDNYRQGITGRRQIVSRLGRFPPEADPDDSMVRKMSWALNNVDVARFIAVHAGKDVIHPGWVSHLQKQELLNLPIGRAEDGTPVTVPIASSQLSDNFDLNEITFHLACWIAKNLDSKEVLRWALTNGAVLHWQFRREIQSQLVKDSQSLPETLQKVWRVLADDSYAHLLSRKGESRRGYLTQFNLALDDNFSLRHFLNQLQPVPIIRFNSDRFLFDQSQCSDQPSSWYEIEMELIGVRYQNEVDDIRKNTADWDSVLTAIVDDLTNLLLESMDWWCEFGRANSNQDCTHYRYRSISPHNQNKFARTWTQLIDLARESFDALVARNEKAKITRILQKWQSIPYPVFRRLTMYAVTEHPELDIEVGLQILLDTTKPTLWGSQCLRETLRFLRKRGQHLQKKQLRRLVRVILQGPPRDMYKRNLTENEWTLRFENEVHLRLHKLKESGVALPARAEKTYTRIQSTRPFQPRGDHSEEFCIYMNFDSKHDPIDQELPLENFSAMSTAQFISWLNKEKNQGKPPWECGGGWLKFVDNDTEAALMKLKDAADKDVWVANTWYRLLFVCRTHENVPHQANKQVAKLLIEMPDSDLGEISREAAEWLEAVRPILKKTHRMKLWRKIWESSVTAEKSEQELEFNVIQNHTGGILGNVLYQELIEICPDIGNAQNTGFPRQLAWGFNRISESDSLSSRLARIRLSPMLFVFYRIHPDWTERTFFRRMDPSDAEYFDQYLWEGFFMFARCPTDLLAAIKDSLLQVLGQLDLLPEQIRSSAVTVFTYLAVPPINGINTEEAKTVIWKLEQKKLPEVAEVLENLLNDAGEKSVALWNETIRSWFTHVWPQRSEDRSSYLSERLTIMAIRSGDAFPLVVNEIVDMLIPGNSSFALYRLVREEENTELVSKYPEASLNLAYKLFHDSTVHLRYLQQLLDSIGKAKPALRNQPQFRQLSVKL